MSAQTPTAEQTDHGAALILGSALGLILASGAAVAVGGWQIWQAKTGAGPVNVPAYQSAPPVAYPANSQPYGGTNTLGSPAPSAGVSTGFSPYSGTNNAGAATNAAYGARPYQPSSNPNGPTLPAAPGP